MNKLTVFLVILCLQQGMSQARDTLYYSVDLRDDNYEKVTKRMQFSPEFVGNLVSATGRDGRESLQCLFYYSPHLEEGYESIYFRRWTGESQHTNRYRVSIDSDLLLGWYLAPDDTELEAFVIGTTGASDNASKHLRWLIDHAPVPQPASFFVEGDDSDEKQTPDLVRFFGGREKLSQLKTYEYQGDGNDYRSNTQS